MTNGPHIIISFNRSFSLTRIVKTGQTLYSSLFILDHADLAQLHKKSYKPARFGPRKIQFSGKKQLK